MQGNKAKGTPWSGDSTSLKEPMILIFEGPCYIKKIADDVFGHITKWK